MMHIGTLLLVLALIFYPEEVIDAGLAWLKVALWIALLLVGAIWLWLSFSA
jgi:hypothetical protein